MNHLSQQVAQALLLGLTGWLRWLYRGNPNIKPVEYNMKILPRQTEHNLQATKAHIIVLSKEGKKMGQYHVLKSSHLTPFSTSSEFNTSSQILRSTARLTNMVQGFMCHLQQTFQCDKKWK
jgi:hypothetical protein